jgi:hypothetical protein
MVVRWQPDGLLKAILVYVGLSMIWIWLPLVRGLMDGPSYRWGWSDQIHGSGVGGSYWVLVLTAAFCLAVLYLGWRGARPPFPWLLLIWQLSLLGQSVALGLSGAVFEGDTLGIRIPLGWILAVADLFFLLLAAVWVVRRRQSSRAPAQLPWAPANLWLLAVVAGLLPAQFALLRFGEPDGLADQIGVILTLIQLGVLNAALYPWLPRQRHDRSVQR